MNAFLAAALTRVMRTFVPIPAVASFLIFVCLRCDVSKDAQIHTYTPTYTLQGRLASAVSLYC